MSTFDVPAADAVRGLTIKVRLKGLRRMRLRIALAARLIAGVNSDIHVELS